MAFLKYKTVQGKPLKRKLAPEEMREWKKQYKKDRERKFIDSWKQDPGFITTLNKMLWSATGASKPMDQKSNIYIFFCNSKFWFLIILFLVA